MRKYKKGFHRVVCGWCTLCLLYSNHELRIWVQGMAHAQGIDMEISGGQEEGIREIERRLIVTYRYPSLSGRSLPKEAREERITEQCSLITIAEDKVREMVPSIVTDPRIAYVEPDYEVRLFETMDRYSERQWAYHDEMTSINAQMAWELGSGYDEEVIVAIIDTGIDYRHADLKDSMWNNEDEAFQDYFDMDDNGYAGDYFGWNFLDNTSQICTYRYSRASGIYEDYHGTHVAGIIRATADNGIGIAGLASYSNVKLMSLKVLGAQFSGNVSDIVRAISYAEQNGATICNLSLGTEDYSEGLYNAMKNSSMLFVCAGGNGDANTDGYGYDISERPVYPACYDLDNIISVANANSTGMIDPSSCYSAEEMDIAAPGTGIISTYVDRWHTAEGVYTDSSGTSMAAPFVTATAAMISSHYGHLSAAKIKQMILGGSKKIEENSDQVVDGAYLDVYGALSHTEMEASVSTSIKEIQNSKDKKYVIKVNNPYGEELTIRYATGKRDVDYFENGTRGKTLKLSNNKATIRVKETHNYTIYLMDSLGNERIYVEQVTISS